jgi:phospholipid/cholesterol/gamma-HCH transport system permease protein
MADSNSIPFISLSDSKQIVIGGRWNAQNVPVIISVLEKFSVPSGSDSPVLAEQVIALDSAGAWVLNAFLQRVPLEIVGLPQQFERLIHEVAKTDEVSARKPASDSNFLISSVEQLNALGLTTVNTVLHVGEFLSFVGEAAIALVGWICKPSRIRWRAVLFNIRSAGFDALPIVSLLSMMLGVVVGYQGADQLVRYGASIFIADVVGLSMLREFAPLMTAIIIAGRSGSAYAAQIGTMAVTEEVDAMKTMGIEPLDVLVLPKVIGLLVALPLLTVFADFLGVFGGMLMAQQKLGISFPEFLSRFVKAVSVTTFFIGIAKAPVFAGIIALVGCYQGFRTKGGADSVGRQTTRSVVQSVFLVIVVDAIFSIAFSALDL